MAASIPSPSDVSCAPAQRRRHLSLRAALATALISWAAGCTDRTLVLVDQSTLRDGLVGLWHFDESSGSTAADSSGNHNDGTLKDFADPSTAWVPGKFGNALAVEAVGYALVQVPSASIDGIVTGVSVSAWVYYAGTISDYGTAISRQINAGTQLDQYYHLSLRGSEGIPNLFVSPTEPSPMSLFGPKAVPRYTWVHLAGTYDATAETPVATLYVNGEAVMTGMVSGRFMADNTPVILGGNENRSEVTERFPGRIDEITLYNRALSPLEVAELAQAPVF